MLLIYCGVNDVTWERTRGLGDQFVPRRILDKEHAFPICSYVPHSLTCATFSSWQPYNELIIARILRTVGSNSLSAHMMHVQQWCLGYIAASILVAPHTFVVLAVMMIPGTLCMHQRNSALNPGNYQPIICAQIRWLSYISVSIVE